MSTSSKKRVANAVGGKTARACDGCIKKRARWYCAADDAFLCQACDSSVHSANPLARRHQRVRLKIAAFLKSLDLDVLVSSKLPSSWHQGFTRKARTPRHHVKTSKTYGDYSSSLLFGNHVVSSLVPEVGLDDQVLSTEENEEDRDHQLLYRVPIFDPSLAEFCGHGKPITTTRVASGTRVVDNSTSDRDTNGKGGLKRVVEDDQEEEGLKGFLESDMDLVNFSADVESLLGRGLEDVSSFGMEELGLVVVCKEKKEKEVVHENSNNENKVKLEEEEEEERVNKECEVDLERGGGDAPFEFSFDYGDNDESLGACGANDEEEEEDQKVTGIRVERDFENYMINNGLNDDGANDNHNNNKKKNKNKNKKRKRETLLKLDYEAVISAWSSQGGSPWTNGCRPDFDPDQCWPDFFGTCGTELQQPYIDHANGIAGGGLHQAITGDGGREARVSRYREKRRTRLFSKKIRYEVRKLNAEKRPRMKGRFVKRATFSAPAFPLLNK